MENKECSKCGEIKNLSEFNPRPDRTTGYRSECKQCQYAGHMKRYYQCKYKAKAKEKAAWAYRTGDIQKPLYCEDCHEDKPLDKHHTDYNKPLEVIWLCKKHHKGYHSFKRQGFKRKVCLDKLLFDI